MTDWSLGNATGANPPEPGVEAALEYMRGHQPNLRWADPGVYRAWPTIEAHIAAQAQEIERLNERLKVDHAEWAMREQALINTTCQAIIDRNVMQAELAQTKEETDGR